MKEPVLRVAAFLPASDDHLEIARFSTFFKYPLNAIGIDDLAVSLGEVGGMAHAASYFILV